jgi:Cu+-exporting ATPase
MEKEELIELQVSGMHCNNCALSVHKLLEKKGLKEIYVDFANDEVKFKTNKPSETPLIISDIEGLGYKVSEESIPIQEKFYEKVENKFYFSLIFTIPLFSHMFLPFHWLHNPLIQLGLMYSGLSFRMYPFRKKCFQFIKEWNPKYGCSHLYRLQCCLYL